MEYLQLSKQKHAQYITGISKFSCFKSYKAIETG